LLSKDLLSWRLQNLLSRSDLVCLGAQAGSKMTSGSTFPSFLLLRFLGYLDTVRYSNLTKWTISLFRHLLPNVEASRQAVTISQLVKEDSRCPIKGMSLVEVW